MDLLTHGLVGIHLARLVPVGRKVPRVALGAAVAASLAPDLDSLGSLTGAAFGLSLHRPGHSLLAALVLGPLLALLAALASRRPVRELLLPLLLLAELCLLGHLALDVCTSWGASLLWPIDPRRTSLDWLYFFDGVLLLLLCLPLIRDFFRSRAGNLVQPSRSASLALTLAGLYVAICGNLHGRARTLALQAALASGGDGGEAEVHAYPAPLGPFLWTTVVRLGPGDWQRSYTSALTGGITPAGTFSSGGDDARAQVALETSVGRDYQAFADSLYVASESDSGTDGSYEVTLGDLRFTGPFASASPYQLWVRVGPDFREVAHALRTGRVDPGGDSLASRTP